MVTTKVNGAGSGWAYNKAGAWLLGDAWWLKNVTLQFAGET